MVASRSRFPCPGNPNLQPQERILRGRMVSQGCFLSKGVLVLVGLQEFGVLAQVLLAVNHLDGFLPVSVFKNLIGSYGFFLADRESGSACFPVISST